MGGDAQLTQDARGAVPVLLRLTPLDEELGLKPQLMKEPQLAEFFTFLPSQNAE